MNNRAVPTRLRRELRFSKSKIANNLSQANLDFTAIKPLTEAFMSSNGLLGLYGSELLLLEKALGLSGGELAVDLVGELISVKKVPAGTGVSYGYLSRTAETTNLGLIAIGFSDGIPRSATNHFQVGIEQTNYSGLGRIAMDQCVVNLGSDNPKIGSEVSFFSDKFPLSAWAEVSGFSQLEILGRITERVARTWSN